MRNILVLGDGAEERAWADWLRSQDSWTPVVADDPDEGLSIPNLDAAIIGGPIDVRGEALRRLAAEGMAIIQLHPPGPNADAYYQVSMSRRETGAVIVPDMPFRLHPGVVRLREEIVSGDLGDFRSLRVVVHASPNEDLARVAFARVADVVRALLGEIQTATASGDPPGTEPEHELIVQLRDEQGRRAEVRVSTESAEAARLVLVGSHGSMALEYDPTFERPARLIRRWAASDEEWTEEFDAWDPRAAIFDALEAAREAAEQRHPSPSPNLFDGARAMELADAAVQSLRRGRTIDLHHEQIDERTNFRAVMTSLGCLMFLGVLAALSASLAGRALGFDWAIYLAYLIPPVLIAFVALQLLQLGIRPEEREHGADEA